MRCGNLESPTQRAFYHTETGGCKAMTSVPRRAMGLALIATFSLAGLAQAELRVGDSAPDFKLTGSDGKTYSLADFRGKQPVVVAWFPKAFTGG